MSEYLKFLCPRWHKETTLELVETDVVMSTEIRLTRDPDVTDYGIREIFDSVPSHYQCGKCGYVLEHIHASGDDAELREYLLSLPINQENKDGNR